MKTLTILACSATLGAAFLGACSSDDAPATNAAVASCTAGNAGNAGNAPNSGGNGGAAGSDPNVSSDPVLASAQRMIEEGRQTFRYETFGDEAFWGDTLKLHQAIAGSDHGGVGAGVSPKAALGLGLKVDVDALPASVVSALTAGTVDLDSPATTLALLQANAVLGVKGTFDNQGNMTSIGIECALCHSTVDDSLVAGIGKRLDGWPNRDLDVGGIVAAAPDKSALTTLLGVDETTLLAVLNGWGPGKFDAEVFFDGKALRPDGSTGATLIPAAFGLAGVNLHTYTGWGSVTYWNALVANLEMHGQGTFYDPRLKDATRFPIAAANNMGNVRHDTDLVTPKLAALHFYQLAIEAPKPKAGSFDAAAATRGQAVFNGDGKCATCHVPPLFTEPGWNMHTPEEIGIDSFQSDRSPDQHYRTTPLKGLWARQKGGFYHDGHFATLGDVIDHYDAPLGTSLTAAQKTDLAQYLLSL